MQKYLQLLQTIVDKGTQKPAARENMPGTLSYFGYQFRHDLKDGFPLLTTKKVSFKNIVTELLWFLRGDTNIKFLIDNGFYLWNEDAYNYYLKICLRYNIKDDYKYSFKDFIDNIKNGNHHNVGPESSTYKLGDCGKQYGALWRNWEYVQFDNYDQFDRMIQYARVDQIKELIEGLKKSPMGRRHIITAWNPATLDDMALNACHVLAQFNCRPATKAEQIQHLITKNGGNMIYVDHTPILNANGELNDSVTTKYTVDTKTLPQYVLDCQMYQRSADVFLGVPYNIASYALLTEILAKITGMIPGEFIHSFGDVHIYDNHMDQVKEQLQRTPKQLPTIEVLARHMDHGTHPDHFEKYLVGRIDLDQFLNSLTKYDFRLKDYNPQPAIKAELSTGLKK